MKRVICLGNDSKGVGITASLRARAIVPLMTLWKRVEKSIILIPRTRADGTHLGVLIELKGELSSPFGSVIINSDEDYDEFYEAISKLSSFRIEK